MFIFEIVEDLVMFLSGISITLLIGFLKRRVQRKRKSSWAF